MGLVADEIVDVVEDRLQIELSQGRDGILGTAVIAGRGPGYPLYRWNMIVDALIVAFRAKSATRSCD